MSLPLSSFSLFFMADGKQRVRPAPSSPRSFLPVQSVWLVARLVFLGRLWREEDMKPRYSWLSALRGSDAAAEEEWSPLICREDPRRNVASAVHATRGEN